MARTAATTSARQHQQHNANTRQGQQHSATNRQDQPLAAPRGQGAQPHNSTSQTLQPSRHVAPAYAPVVANGGIDLRLFVKLRIGPALLQRDGSARYGGSGSQGCWVCLQRGPHDRFANMQAQIALELGLEANTLQFFLEDFLVLGHIPARILNSGDTLTVDLKQVSDSLFQHSIASP
ncbi:hypothetical protein WJX73_004766 [Symbiochloris irregularis]|uniref:Uncharacterized protein n=1 Tax=Symbiochloris irregularis TaxID=706552 RepID=A0AAW1NU31_9CHLO